MKTVLGNERVSDILRVEKRKERILKEQERAERQRQRKEVDIR